MPTILARIKVQVSVIHGEFDVIPAIETFAFLKARIPQCASTKLTCTGYFPWLEHQSVRPCLERIHLELSTPCNQVN